MLTAGDEFGRSQRGNNNAYAQDNPVTWIDWDERDRALEDHVAALAAWRADRTGWFAQFPEQGVWENLDGEEMSVSDWEQLSTRGFVFRSVDPRRSFTLRVDRPARNVEMSGPG